MRTTLLQILKSSEKLSWSSNWFGSLYTGIYVAFTAAKKKALEGAEQTRLEQKAKPDRPSQSSSRCFGVWKLREKLLQKEAEEKLAMKVISIDAGRKYFSLDQLKRIVSKASWVVLTCTSLSETMVCAFVLDDMTVKPMAKPMPVTMWKRPF